MKIKRINIKNHENPVPVYCFHEPINNECIFNVNNTNYASYQCVNFRFLFGGSFFGFKDDIEDSWSIDEMDEYIKKNNLELLLDKDNNIDKALTVAKDIRVKFFETYPGLDKWIKKQPKISKKFGYMECLIGGRRHLPQMIYTTDSTNEYKKELNNLENISINSRIQTFEALTIYKAMTDINNEIEKRGLKSIIVGMVHDSIVSYVHKNEVEEMYHILKNSMENKTDYNVELLADISIGNVWGFGEEVDENSVKKYLKN